MLFVEGEIFLHEWAFVAAVKWAPDPVCGETLVVGYQATQTASEDNYHELEGIYCI